MTTPSLAPPAPSFLQATAPAWVLLTLLLYGLVLRPLALAQAPLALETIFVFSAAFAMAELFWLGFSWNEIQGAIIHRLGRALPAIFILFAIGLLVGAWIIAGTIPMLVAWGVTLVSPGWIYPLAFLIPVLFSLLTGTSWGSAGTIGVVLMGIGISVGADPAVLAGAIIGGAYFGDKLSPLSDTTNIAAIATEVPLFSHIRAMLWTTLPAAALALAAYTALGLLAPPAPATDLAAPEAFAAALGGLFNFHLALLLPPLIVLAGAWRGAPTLPLLLLSIVVATGLALLLQPFDAAQITAALKNGYRLTFSEVSGPLPEGVAVLLERGGLYSMSEAIFVAMLVFLFVGAIDLLETMPRLVNWAFAFARKPSALVLSALGATAVTNAMTSNQSATSFIVGDAFSRRFDGAGVPRPLLSRSIEDTGTMLESLVPWHATALFMVATLGVPVAAYAPWQLLSLFNFAFAILFALFGQGLLRSPAPSKEASS